MVIVIKHMYYSPKWKKKKLACTNKTSKNDIKSKGAKPPEKKPKRGVKPPKEMESDGVKYKTSLTLTLCFRM